MWDILRARSGDAIAARGWSFRAVVAFSLPEHPFGDDVVAPQIGGLDAAEDGLRRAIPRLAHQVGGRRLVFAAGGGADRGAASGRRITTEEQGRGAEGVRRRGQGRPARSYAASEAAHLFLSTAGW
jgi:hypothetical protein